MFDSRKNEFFDTIHKGIGLIILKQKACHKMDQLRCTKPDRVTPCPGDIPAGYYRYGRKKHSPGHRPPQSVDTLADVPVGKERVNTEAPDDTEESSEQTELDPPFQGKSLADSLPVDAVESEEEWVTETEPEPSRDQISRYGLRKRVNPPQKLLRVSSGRAS